jgi:hypothetical protein
MNAGESTNGEGEHLSSRISGARLCILFFVFLLIALGLGYPVLNRFDPSKTPGLSDVRSYAALVKREANPGPAHLQFRVLVPVMARPIYLLAKGRIGTWDPVMLGLMAVDALFVAATAFLIVVLGIRELHDWPTTVVASLLYFLNFCVPNMRLAGLVDAGEGFFLLALLWSLSRQKFRFLPIIGVLGALTKESFIPISIAFGAAWLFASRKERSFWRLAGPWIASSWLASLIAIVCAQWRISGRFVSLIAFGTSLHGNRDYWHHFVFSIWDRNLLYVFVWLLPTALPLLAKFPKSWLVPTGTAVAMVFVLDGYYGGGAGTVGRELFSVAGPVLCLSSARFLCGEDSRTLTKLPREL